MKSKGILVAACGALAVMALAEGSAQAGGGYYGSGGYRNGHAAHGKYHYRRKQGTRVRGFLLRRGGYYSYSDEDVINTYEGVRTSYGMLDTFRDPYQGRQSSAGPFDHGFFFDSGVSPRGGDSPYPR
jgi:hypothetical protein